MRFFILLLLMMPFCSFANVMDTMQNISTKNTTLPLYNDDELQALLFGKELRRDGRLLVVTGPCIDLIRDNVNLRLIKTGGVEIYPLNAPIADVVKFWKNRIVFSDGIVSSNHADVDQSIRQAFGKGPVHFRSPAIDIDGVGYHANYKERHCLIKSNVKITIRNGASDIRKILQNGGIAPKKLNLVNAVADELFIHLKKGEIILTGNVVIREPKGTVKCDKMVILLDRSKKDADNEALHGSSVKEINCYGNIQIDMNENNDVQDDSGAAIKFFGFHDLRRQMLSAPGTAVFCNAPDTEKTESMVVAGTRVNAKQMRWDFQKNTINFINDVRIRDRRLKLDCGTLTIHLPPKGSKQQNTVSKIEADSSVRLIDDDYQLEADRIVLYFPKDKSIGDGPDDVRAFGNVIITHFKKDDQNQIISKSTLSSDKATLIRPKNKAIFLGNVKVRNDSFSLDSDQLHIFAEKYPEGTVFPPTPKGEAPSRIRINNELELKHITAYKNVTVFRKNESGDEKAIGDRADYFIKHRKITLTGTPEQAPVLYKGENLLATEIGSKILVDLNEQTASTVGSGAELHIKEDLNKRK